MRSIDVSIAGVTFGNPNDSQNFGAFVSRLQEILQNISQLSKVKIVIVAPTDKELEELFDTSEVVILHHATASSRKIWYKFQGTAYSIQGS